MKQNKILGVFAIAMTLVLAACGGGGGGKSSRKPTHKHEYDAGVVTTEPTCTTEGVKTYTCKNTDGLCTKVTKTESVPALGHEKPVPFVATEEVAATCEVDGHVTYECARCHQSVTETIAATGHEWKDAEDQTGAVEPTCTEEGTKIQVCENDPTHTRTVPVPATGHDLNEGTLLPIPDENETNTKGEIPYHWAKITNYSCKHGDFYRYSWSAKEVNFNYKDVPAGQDPELLDEGTDGIRFWGRPIGNAIELSDEGRATAESVSVPDPSVKGSRFEFDFVFDADVNDVCLSAEFEPAQYTSDVFKNADNTEDWTPGYKNIEIDNPGEKYTQEEIDAAVEGDPAYGKTVDDWKVAPTYKGDKIKPFRFIILLDGEEVVLDSSVSTPANGKQWYQFPCRLNLSAGKHNLNIAMSGGYLHTFYNFSFEKVPPVHQHNFATETDVAAKGDGYVGYKTATCAKEGAQRINIRAMDGTFADGSSNKTGSSAPLEGYMKLAGNDQSISYKFDYAGQAATAKLYQYGYMDNFSSNGNRTYTSQNGGSLGANGCNFGVKFNNSEVTISDATKAITYSEFFSGATVSPGGSGNSNLAACYIGDVSLVNGDNTFSFTRYNSFNLSVSNFYLVIEA